jgi:hypothetical protein
MTYIVKSRHVGMNEISRHVEKFSTVVDAEKRASEINNKPFSPYYSWVEKVEAPKPAANSYIG